MTVWQTYSDDRVGAGTDGHLLEAHAVALCEGVPEAPGTAVRIAIELDRRRAIASCASGNRPYGPSSEASLTTRSKPSSRCTPRRVCRARTNEPASVGRISDASSRRARRHVAGMDSGAVTYSPTISLSTSTPECSTASPCRRQSGWRESPRESLPRRGRARRSAPTVAPRCASDAACLASIARPYRLERQVADRRVSPVVDTNPPGLFARCAPTRGVAGEWIARPSATRPASRGLRRALHARTCRRRWSRSSARHRARRGASMRSSRALPRSRRRRPRRSSTRGSSSPSLQLPPTSRHVRSRPTGTCQCDVLSAEPFDRLLLGEADACDLGVGIHRPRHPALSGIPAAYPSRSPRRSRLRETPCGRAASSRRRSRPRKCARPRCGVRIGADAGARIDVTAAASSPMSSTTGARRPTHMSRMPSSPPSPKWTVNARAGVLDLRALLAEVDDDPAPRMPLRSSLVASESSCGISVSSISTIVTSVPKRSKIDANSQPMTRLRHDEPLRHLGLRQKPGRVDAPWRVEPGMGGTIEPKPSRRSWS